MLIDPPTSPKTNIIPLDSPSNRHMKQAFHFEDTMILTDHISAFIGDPNDPHTLIVRTPDFHSGDTIHAFELEHYSQYFGYIVRVNPADFIHFKTEDNKDFYLKSGRVALVRRNKTNCNAEIILDDGTRMTTSTLPMLITKQFNPQ